MKIVQASEVALPFSPRSKERPEDLAGEGEVDLLIATDCISEGQNHQDCDTLVNYDIHWNPVRIIQRFGRIDRIGSCNERIQLVNFWPNMELEEYIKLEQRVSGRMVLLDISATGEENMGPAGMATAPNDPAAAYAQLMSMIQPKPPVPMAGQGGTGLPTSTPGGEMGGTSTPTTTRTGDRVVLVRTPEQQRHRRR